MGLNLKQKLNVIQTKLKAPKSQYNDFGKYYYRSCEDILESVKPLLGETGTTLVLSDEAVAVGNRVYIKAKAMLLDGEIDDYIEATAFAREDEVKKGMDGSQISGSASSYARKYALNGLFAIDDTKDADGLNDEKEPPKTPVKPKVPVKAKKQDDMPFPEVPPETKSEKLLKALGGDTDRFKAAQEWINKQCGEKTDIDELSDADFSYVLSKIKK